ncbi:MAG TPA: HD domain-containing phosphohydrolase [Armatimonadota bacterium]|nr:HD domain-containing phosphohydrolase [Armatimonadota bacterium]
MSLPGHELIRILVVDDEDVVREPLTEALGWVGYAADGAASVDEALDLLNQNQYDLLFCDLVMPGANGFTLMEVARRKYPSLPVIVLTGHATVDLTQKAIRLGAQDFIIKPFSVRELPFIVERNLERVRLEAQLREQQTEHLLFQTVQALAAAIEAKDPYTAGHSQKVAQLALQFSQALQLSDTDVFVLRLAGLMHDVGKIGIPEGVLLKPGQLNDHEWEIMKQHPVIGAEIVGQITDLAYVAKVVRSHHERWDGTGYPDGLKEEGIPFLSRILYISDAYDALTADRAYRKGMSHEQAIEIIRKQAGIHFDRDLVMVMEEKVLPVLEPYWQTPDGLMTHLSRTKQEALNAQEAYSGE